LNVANLKYRENVLIVSKFDKEERDMRTLVKYSTEPKYNLSYSYLGGYPDADFLWGSGIVNITYPATLAKEVESQVTMVKSNGTWQQVSIMAAMHERHLRFYFFKTETKDITSSAVVAKKLGKSYHRKDEEINGIKNIKKLKAMKTFAIKRILVPTDFSETGKLAIEHAAYMAKLCKAHLYLLHVVESFEYAYSEYEPEIIVKDLEGVQSVATEKLEKLAAKLASEHSIKVTTLLNTGKPALGIADSVKDNNIDIIIMGTHGAKGFEEFIIGSNAHRVVNVSPCPVITIQASAKDIRFTNIVMPIDNSMYSRQKVNYVIELASHYKAKIHMVGLLDSNEEMTETDEKKFNIKLDAVENILKQSGLSYVRKLVKGHNIAVEAMKYSNEVNGDLLVIMTDHESSLSGVFMGPLAKQIVNHSKIPVMSIHPVETMIAESNSEAVNPFS